MLYNGYTYNFNGKNDKEIKSSDRKTVVDLIK